MMTEKGFWWFLLPCIAGSVIHALHILLHMHCMHCTNVQYAAPKPVGRRARKPGVDRKPRQAYSAKQLDKLEAEFKVKFEL